MTRLSSRGPTSSPMSKLPVELLAEIFHLTTHCTTQFQTVGQKELTFNFASVVTPLTLSSVNHQWRRVALSIPSLWSSICVTPDDVLSYVDEDDPSQTTQTVLDLPHLVEYVARSRKAPLDILIDARDPEWSHGMEEPGSPQSPTFEHIYTPPFSSKHMSTILNLLVPHITRWRSFTILTDMWTPMYTALARLQSSFALGAPLLQSLTLMRCNEFASYLPEFSPRELSTPLSILSLEHAPSLREITLRGVHLDWDAFTKRSTEPESALRSLELSYHAMDVRPGVQAFRDLLSASPNLQNLVLNVSGPVFQEDDLTETQLTPVTLPHLENLTIGFTSAHETSEMLKLLDAPHLHVLEVADASSPGAVANEDAGCLLNYLGTGSLGGEVHRTQPVLPKSARSGSIVPSATSGWPGAIPVLENENSSTTPPFASLRRVTLRSTTAQTSSFKTFFDALPHVSELELTRTSPNAIRALFAQSHPVESRPPSCARLRNLIIRGADTRDVEFVTESLTHDSTRPTLDAVDMFVDAPVIPAEREEDILVIGGVTLRVVKEAFCPVGDDDEEGEGEDPFEVGGTFNDAAFDDFYRGLSFVPGLGS